MALHWPNLERILGLRHKAEPKPGLVVVGLGNPGPEYAQTRHNAGFWCVDRLADRHSIAVTDRRRTAVLGAAPIEGRRVVLAKPRTFVNRSGLAATYLLARYKLTPAELLVVCDDVALPLGKVRLRARGSSGGHRGIESIIDALGTQDFPRLRIGVGQPPADTSQVDYVLGTMSDEEMVAADLALEASADAVAALLSSGIDVAMNTYN